MTDHEQNAAIGDLTKRYSDAKRKKAALTSELSKCRVALASFSSVLMDKVEGVRSYPPVSSATIPKLPADYPTPERLSELLDDLRATLSEVEHTHKLLKDAGVDIA